nr:hypothetical protein CFP56_55563 [Quercus suber]
MLQENIRAPDSAIEIPYVECGKTVSNVSKDCFEDQLKGIDTELTKFDPNEDSTHAGFIFNNSAIFPIQIPLVDIIEACEG